MAEEKVKPVKKEKDDDDDDDDDDDNVPIAASRAKAVKKEEPKEEEDGDLLLTLSRNKKRKPIAPSRPKKEELGREEDHKIKKKEEGKSNARVSKAKKEDLEEEDEVDKADKEKKKKRKKEEKQKVVGKKATGAASPAKEKREKKVYALPGQKHEPPEERDPLRIFYETLYRQVPNSEMAAFWMMEWGLLPVEEAKKVYEKKLKRAQQQKLGSPLKTVSVKKTATVSVTKEKGTASKTAVNVTTKRKASDLEADDDDVDFIVHKKTIKKQKVSS